MKSSYQRPIGVAHKVVSRATTIFWIMFYEQDLYDTDNTSVIIVATTGYYDGSLPIVVLVFLHYNRTRNN